MTQCGVIQLPSTKRSRWFSRRLLIMGSKNAAVLPEPVWAHAMRSRPAMMIGIEYCWIGVNLV